MLYEEFELKKSIQHEPRSYKIIIHLQIQLKISLFSKLEHFKYIALIKISPWCAIFFFFLVVSAYYI